MGHSELGHSRASLPAGGSAPAGEGIGWTPPGPARLPAPSFKYAAPAGASSSPRTQDGGVWTCTEDVLLVGGAAATAARGGRGRQTPGPGRPQPRPGPGGQPSAPRRATWRRRSRGSAPAASVISVPAAAAAATAASAAAAAFPGGWVSGPAGRIRAWRGWRGLEAGGGRVLQGGRDPCVSQAYLEQQPGGAGVLAGREGGEEAGRGREVQACYGPEGVAGLGSR